MLTLILLINATIIEIKELCYSSMIVADDTTGVQLYFLTCSEIFSQTVMFH